MIVSKGVGLSNQELFREYLREIPDELLLHVLEDCIWLHSEFASDPNAPTYLWRVQACRAECDARADCRHRELGRWTDTTRCRPGRKLLNPPGRFLVLIIIKGQGKSRLNRAWPVGRASRR
jgi:hypothetical protein